MHLGPQKQGSQISKRTSGKTEDERTVGNPAQTSVKFQGVHSGQLQKKGAGLLVTFLGRRGVNKIYNYTAHFYSVSQCRYIVIKNTFTKK